MTARRATTLKKVWSVMRQDCVEKVNRSIAEDAYLATSQIRRFLVLHKELDPDDGELTRTLITATRSDIVSASS